MNKGDLISLAKNLGEEVLYARAYKDILDQYTTVRKKYRREISLSPAFYGISEMALIEALSMRLARLYDSDNKSAGLRYLMREVEENVNLFPKNRGEHVLKDDDNVFSVIIPLKHTLRKCEERYFKERVDREKSILRLFSSFEDEHLESVEIEVTIDELISMYHKRFHALEKVSKNLINQRNKIYAHNDRDLNFNYDSVYKANPLSHKDVDELIEFAEDYTGFCYEYLSGKYAFSRFKNIDDWENTLVYAQKGIEETCRTWKEEYGEEFCPFSE